MTNEQPLQQYLIDSEPYYAPQNNEIELFEAAYRNAIPVLLKGPTGCGKTRFMEHIAWRLKRPLVTVSCHDDLTAADLVGAVFNYRRGDALGRWTAEPGGARRRDLLLG